ncbi:methyl-accepting chemotaxis protein [Roseibium aggregatum]|uniref:methyl-accepting chemotaxis protein n=1 Tax=Roseibium aggregatum TaxID=187304 RepID=UPI001E4397BE|nr:HAMP domain-containing methyl-accepting chemotaxis protein [Roseibium aggregatum]
MKMFGQSALARVGALSVKLKILSLSLLTAIGMLTIGGVFWWSQNEVAGAFNKLDQSAGLARSVADLSDIANGMRNIGKGYLARPEEKDHELFEAKLSEAHGVLDDISAKPVAAAFNAEIADVRDTLDGASGAFSSLNTVQREIGFNSETGLRATLSENADEVLKRLKKEMRFGGGPDFEKMVTTMLDVQLSEKKFILDRNDVALGNFEVAFGRYERLLKKAYLPNEIKEDVGTKMAIYREAFDAYTAAVAEKDKSIELLETLFDLVPPRLEALNNAARDAELAAEQDLETVRAYSTLAVVSVIAAFLVSGVLAGMLIGRSIANPLSRLQNAMEELASGHVDVNLPAAKGSVEIAAMARTVSVFQDNAVERQRLAAASEEENAQRDARVARLESLIANFEATVGQALESLDRSTSDLTQTSAAVEAAADDVAQQADRAGNAVRVAAENVNSAASASEELAASINEISNQASNSTTVAKKAVASAEGTSQTMGQLSRAADRIGEVMGLIRDIANQTNLLALNATIEAARAGEAGKGFAVVAAEVKQLADQTSRATEDIASQVEAIQMSSSHALEAIDEVTGIISEMEGLASAVASAVIQQDAAVQSIAKNVVDASTRSHEGAECMTAVGSATEHARATGGEVEQLATSLSEQAALIRSEISNFLSGVRAA